ncbi:MAG: hypothetical protein WCJ30_01780 [Deltaproteobacteria bacterium]
MPNVLPMSNGRDPQIAWDSLLGAPSARGPDDFDGRVATAALNSDSAEGPVSMQPHHPDPECPDRVVPACRREGTTYRTSPPLCTTTEQDFARPARRLTEIARRLDEDLLCNGVPCRTGRVLSICADGWRQAVPGIVEKVACREPGIGTPPVGETRDSNGHTTMACRVFETQPAGVPCDPARARTPVAFGLLPPTATADGEALTVCEIPQVAVDANHQPVAGAAGWYWRVDNADRVTCPHGPINFPRGLDPVRGAVVRAWCVHTDGTCGGAPD